MRALPVVVALIVTSGCGRVPLPGRDAAVTAGQDGARDSAPPPDAAADVQADVPDPVDAEACDLGPDLDPACEQLDNYDFNACYWSPGKGLSGSNRWFGDVLCGTCRFAPTGKVLSDCYLESREGAIYCARSCTECCFRNTGVPCDTDGECCAPLRCVRGDAGKRCQQQP
jgi:hypothetical protein